MPRQGGSLFFCQHCGHESARWMGFCSACGDRSPLVEAPSSVSGPVRGWARSCVSKPQELSNVKAEETQRISMGFSEMDRVLGGGLVPGSLVLFAGEPGVGKSTLLLQAACFVAGQDRRVLYVSGEESERQIKLRAQRLGLQEQDLYVLVEADVDRVLQQLEHDPPSLVVVDSVQALFTEQISSGPGSVVQVRECALRLIRWAKTKEVPVLLAGHVTKDGTVAGPRVLEHVVDVVLYLEGENLGSQRLLRSVKNRFGSTNEVGMFEMKAAGMEEVLEPSQVLLSERSEGAVGSAVAAIMEGSRPMLVEIQALTSRSVLPTPRRSSNGVDYNRTVMITAVLSRRAKLNLTNQDIIVNVIGGLRVTEPAADLAQALAIASSLKNSPLPQGLVVIGEVGLTGELRSVPYLERRLIDVTRLGFSTCLLPATAIGKMPPIEGLKLLFAPTIGKAIEIALSNGPGDL